MAQFALYSVAPEQGGSATSLGVRSAAGNLRRGAYVTNPRFLQDVSGGGLHGSIGVGIAVLRPLSEAPEASQALQTVVGSRLDHLESELRELRDRTVSRERFDSEKMHRLGEEDNRAELRRAGDEQQDTLAKCLQDRDAVTREKSQVERLLVAKSEELKGAQQRLANARQEKMQASVEIEELRARLQQRSEDEIQQIKQAAVERAQQEEGQARNEEERKQMETYNRGLQSRSENRQRTLEEAKATATTILTSQTAADVPRAAEVYTDTAERLVSQREVLNRQLADLATSREVKKALRQEIGAFDVDIGVMREAARRVSLPSKPSMGFEDRRISFGNAWRLMLREGERKKVDSTEIWEAGWSQFLTRQADFLPPSKLAGALDTEVKNVWGKEGWLRMIADRTDAQKQSQERILLEDGREIALSILSASFGDTIKRIIALGKPSRVLVTVPSVKVPAVMDWLLSLDFALERIYQGLDQTSTDFAGGDLLIHDAVDVLNSVIERLRKE